MNPWRSIAVLASVFVLPWTVGCGGGATPAKGKILNEGGYEDTKGSGTSMLAGKVQIPVPAVGARYTQHCFKFFIICAGGAAFNG